MQSLYYQQTFLGVDWGMTIEGQQADPKNKVTQLSFTGKQSNKSWQQQGPNIIKNAQAKTGE